MEFMPDHSRLVPAQSPFCGRADDKNMQEGELGVLE